MAGERVDIAALKARINLVDVAAKAGVALKKKGHEHIGCCPFHQEKGPSFTVYEKGKGQAFKCFGCGANGDVIEFVQKIYGYTPGEAIRFLNGDKSLSEKPRAATMSVKPGVRGEEERARKKKALARKIWIEASDNVAAPLLATYLESRGINVGRIGGVPDSLRLHPQLEHINPETGESSFWPAMLAPVVNAHGKIQAIHRTFLMPDGSGKAPVDPAKMVLGPMRGGYIPLSQMSEHLHIGEGIESLLSVREMHGPGSYWTCIALGNMKNLPVPAHAQSVTIWADNDMKDPGEGQKDPRELIYQAAEHYRQLKPGRRVRIAWPPKGMDFNDCLKAGQHV